MKQQIEEENPLIEDIVDSNLRAKTAFIIAQDRMCRERIFEAMGALAIAQKAIADEDSLGGNLGWEEWGHRSQRVFAQQKITKK